MVSNYARKVSYWNNSGRIFTASGEVALYGYFSLFARYHYYYYYYTFESNNKLLKSKNYLEINSFITA